MPGIRGRSGIGIGPAIGAGPPAGPAIGRGMGVTGAGVPAIGNAGAALPARLPVIPAVATGDGVLVRVPEPVVPLAPIELIDPAAPGGATGARICCGIDFSSAHAEVKKTLNNSLHDNRARTRSSVPSAGLRVRILHLVADRASWSRDAPAQPRFSRLWSASSVQSSSHSVTDGSVQLFLVGDRRAIAASTPFIR